MNQETILAQCVKAANRYWIFVDEKEASAQMIFHESRGQLQMAVLCVGRNVVKEHLKASGIMVPICVKVDAV